MANPEYEEFAALSPVFVPETEAVSATVKVLVPVIVIVPVPVVRVFPLTEVGVMAPRVKAKAPAVLTAETPFPVVTELTNVPEVGRVTEVPAVVKRDKAFVGEKVTTSPPPSGGISSHWQ